MISAEIGSHQCRVCAGAPDYHVRAIGFLRAGTGYLCGPCLGELLYEFHSDSWMDRLEEFQVRRLSNGVKAPFKRESFGRFHLYTYWTHSVMPQHRVFDSQEDPEWLRMIETMTPEGPSG